MDYNNKVSEVNDKLTDMLYSDALLSKIVLIILLCACLAFSAFALQKKLKHRWESTYYLLLGASVFVFAVCAILSVFLAKSDHINIPGEILNIGILPIPALLCLHIRQQTSYKELHPVQVALLFAVPAFLILLTGRDILLPQILRDLPLNRETQWYALVFYVYAITALIWSYLLCFNVMYQMPHRTRGSTRYMLVGVSSVALLFSIDALWAGQFSTLIPQSDTLDIFLPLGAPIAFFFLIYPLYKALDIMPSADVIVTSREFVMGGLDTTVLVLNSRKRILDWNRKDWEDGFPLPRPLYKEPIEKYRERILGLSTCRVSPHSGDIIIIATEGREMYFSLREHEIGNNKKNFGYIVEVPEVTSIYSIVRYYEEIAHIDTLTGLHNRNAYFNYVEHITDGKNFPLLIFVGDVNYLKKINDTYGHLLGDQLLITIASLIKKAMPPGAFVARTGGDEFVLLIPGGNVEIAERFVLDLIDMCDEINHEIFGSPSISWGYAIMTSEDESYNEVFERADALMYEYKKARHEFRSSGLLPNKPDPEPAEMANAG